jgi:hypothetical protein
MQLKLSNQSYIMRKRPTMMVLGFMLTTPMMASLHHENFLKNLSKLSRKFGLVVPELLTRTGWLNKVY